ncbi:hypothetical protein [Dyadobacter aurulentus]|uniref:hypothetical protein n=1 Tax=Dyadobacter sp. UC 10 TaxID=2605428 RepID=UPI0011F3B3AB|nr:hypothetical protein [Dyadobacter sp. UC 10]KAA0992133.1 hypothetical protein FXO21_19095 [Dyadobacter sp. UC 10]
MAPEKSGICPAFIDSYSDCARCDVRYFYYSYIKAFTEMDEVKQRVQLEAVVIGLSLTVMLLMSLFLLSLCGISNPVWFGYGHLVGYCWLFYFIGWFVSRKKYGV